MSINTTLVKWDILSFSCYKYVGVIAVLLIGAYSSLTYYLTLAYVSSALFFFLLRTLRLRIEPEVRIRTYTMIVQRMKAGFYFTETMIPYLYVTLINIQVHGMEMHGKRKLYLMLLYAGLQPVLIWWLTSWYVPLTIGTQNGYGDPPPIPAM